MEKEYIERAKEIGTAYAEQLHEHWSEHSEVQKNWPWPKFTDFCGRVSSECLSACFSDEEWGGITETQKSELKEKASKIAISRARELVDTGEKEDKNEFVRDCNKV